jgi:hypothetical protein
MKKAAVPSILVAVVLLALGVIAEAQQPKKVPRIGYLSSFEPASDSARAEAIRLALRELGYIEGQNIAFEYRYAEGCREISLSERDSDYFICCICKKAAVLYDRVKRQLAIREKLRRYARSRSAQW